MCEVKIEKLDNQGRGICYVNNKITFVENSLPNEQVKISITKESKKYNEAIVTDYLVTSKDRVESPCPYFKECGGCELLNLSYENTCIVYFLLIFFQRMASYLLIIIIYVFYSVFLNPLLYYHKIYIYLVYM